MHRAFLVACATAIAVLLAACGSLPVQALFGNEVSFSQAQLQASLDRSFPKRYERLGGLLEVRLTNPRLRLPAGSQRLAMDVDIDVDGLGRMNERDGTLTLTSGLRFDAATRGLHLDAPTIDRLEMPALGGTLGGSARGLLNDWLADYARAEPIHRFDDSLVERLGARRINATRIDNGRIVLDLGPDR